MMKLSIWQQFASNHSNDFNLVGEFKSHEAAVKAAAELLSLLKRIEHYYQVTEEYDEYAPNGIEKQLTQELQIEVGRRIDWLDVPGVAERAIKVIDNYMFVSSDGYSRDGGSGEYPLDIILEKKFGAVVTFGGLGSLFVSVSATAPDESTARTLVQQGQAYLDYILDSEVNDWVIQPWLEIYYPEAYAFSIARSELYEKVYEEEGIDGEDRAGVIALEERIAPWLAESPWRRLIYDVWYKEDNSYFQGLREVRDQEFQVSFLSHLIFKTFTRLSHEGRRVNLLKMSFSHPGAGLEAVMMWLKSFGCEDIQYRYELWEYHS